MGHATMLYPTMWLRGRTYWLPRVVPLDLRERLGLTEVRRSLRTKDHDEAKRRWKIESIKVDRLFEDARRGAVVQPTLPRNVSEVDRDYYVDRLVDDDQGDRRLPDHVRRRYLAIVQDDGSPRCSEVLERWVKERQPPSKTEAEWRKNFARFIALGLDGQDIPIRQVTRSHVRTFKDRLLVAKGTEQGSGDLPTDGVEDHHGGEVGLLLGGQQRAHRGRESVSGDHRGEREGAGRGSSSPAVRQWQPQEVVLGGA